jgi:hypothetical protein
MMRLEAAKYSDSIKRTSSASRLSLKVVNPVRSANRTQTSRRSTAGRPNTAAPGDVAGSPAASVGLSAEPHSRQNRCPDSCARVPQAGQAAICGAPH